MYRIRSIKTLTTTLYNSRSLLYNRNHSFNNLRFFTNKFKDFIPKKPSTNKDNKNEVKKKKKYNEDKPPTPENIAKEAFEQFEKQFEEIRKKSGINNKNNTNKNNNNKDPKKNKDDPNPAADIPLLFFVLVILFGLNYFTDVSDEFSGKEITFQDFKKDILPKQKVKLLRVDDANNKVYVILGDSSSSSSDYNVGGNSINSNKNVNNNRPSYWFTIGSVESFERSLENAQYDLKIPLSQYVAVKYVDGTSKLSSLLSVVPTLLTIALFFMIFKNISNMSGGIGGKGGGPGGIFGVGKAKYTKIKANEGTGVLFKDVAGLDEAKVEIMEFVAFLKDAKRFEKLGAKIPKGALLVGPPGTGKTLLAKATAGEANVPFFSISGSDFIEMFVGVGPSRVRDLFKSARENAPCIIFIDEIDAVGRSRSSSKFGGGNDERENTLNQLLVEMDGFKTKEGVVILAGTNRIDILDKALLRPGRFDRTINIDKPDIKGRRQIFLIHLQKILTAESKKKIAKRLAALTPGFAGADIMNVCNEGAIIAARDKADKVSMKHFEQAVDRVLGGLERKNSSMTQYEKKLVAYHEAGHAVAGWFLEHADPLLKVTIVPRSNGALGFAQYLPKELSLYQTEQLKDMMCMTLAGRAAEEIFFGKISTGASNDLEKVTNIAYSIVAVYGMSPDLPNVAFHRKTDEQQFTKPFSEKTAQKIDHDIQQQITNAYTRTITLLKQKKNLVKGLAEKLIEVETVNHDDIVEILGPRPFKDNQSYNEYVSKGEDIEPQQNVDDDDTKATKKKK